MTQPVRSEAQERRRNISFGIEHEDFFFGGCLVVGPVRPFTEYSNDPRRPGKHLRDDDTGLLMWKLPVTDPAAGNAARMSYDVTLLSDTEPVLPGGEFALGAPIRFTGLRVSPRVGGTGEFRHIAYAVRASGVEAPRPASAPPSSGAGSGARSSGASGAGSGKSAAS
ncbi:hypothetical protein ABZ894_11820 [Nocardia beijingensis]|uniref:hypothetical protein n=1 Tax=Nocardia beijingensis TaxID=95162 RepID=UPI0033C2CB7C